MQIILLIIRLVLFGVFAAAGLAKLADRAGCRRMLVSFGVPRVFSNLFALGLPAVELIVAACLLPVGSARYGAVAALLLLFLFIGGITYNLSQGRAPECNCFGQIHSAPIGWSTLVRNATLAVLAGVLIGSGKQNVGPSIIAWIGDLTSAQRLTVAFDLAAVLLLAAGTALLVQLLRQQGRILLRLEGMETRLASGATGAVQPSSGMAAGLQIGVRAPSFQLDTLHGRSVTLEALLAPGKAVLLLFTNPNCGPCGALMPEVSDWLRKHGAVLTVALISEGSAEDNRAKSVIDELGQVLLQRKREVAEIYHAWGTPAAVLVRADGIIGSSVAQGAEAIRTLVTEAVADRIPALAGSRPAVKIGDLAPAVDFMDLVGKRVGFKDFPLGNLLLLFWNPACGFCQQMLNELKDWEQDPPPGAPSLVLISTGTVEDNRAMRLRSPVVIDDTLRAGSAFGAKGTPMGVLIDAKGRIASEVVAGARAVLALANSGGLPDVERMFKPARG